MTKISAKEKLFCACYCESRNGAEAAARAGYAMPRRAYMKLMEKQGVKDEIARLSAKNAAGLDEVCAGYRRLAFGSCADALKLLFMQRIPESSDEFEQLDLFNVAEIKRPKDGALEIKFFDRLKALEHLQELGDFDSTGTALPFFEALERSAGTKKHE